MSNATSALIDTKTILLAEDDLMTRIALGEGLRTDGFVVEEAATGTDAIERVRRGGIDLVVLDVGLPGVNGLDVLTRLRRDIDVPIIVVTARGEEPDRVLGLQLGADDYVPKPVTPRELSARIRAVLRRTSGQMSPPEERLEFEGLLIDLGAREVAIGGELVELTAKEFDLLARLADSPRRVLSREQLLNDVWESRSDWQDPATVTEHVRRLRLKIEPDAKEPRWIHTIRGVGYRFEP